MFNLNHYAKMVLYIVPSVILGKKNFRVIIIIKVSTKDISVYKYCWRRMISNFKISFLIYILSEANNKG